MFQQFKSIFPNASLNISSITNSISIPEASLNRLDAIRNEFTQLNAFFQNQPVSETRSVSVEQPTKTSLMELEATGQVIQKIQKDLETIHTTNLENQQKQKSLDSLLEKLQTTGELHIEACEQWKESEERVNHIRYDITNIQENTNQLLCKLKALEQHIDQVNATQEQRQFEAWKQKEEEVLMNQVALRRQHLKEKEANLKSKYEEVKEVQQKKRLELYEASFNAELEEYKRKRNTEISSLYSNPPNCTIQTSLEQLHLGDGNGDELDEFFGDEKETKTRQSKEDDTFSDDERVDILRDEDYEDF
ncbi:hypothetical protein BY458DRAFT_524308 [Sporodiniella umbellata]|nr:hypothetical protein BY458DRAFT_524308 [Sporodiniella umbellata]